MWILGSNYMQHELRIWILEVQYQLKKQVPTCFTNKMSFIVVLLRIMPFLCKRLRLSLLALTLLFVLGYGYAHFLFFFFSYHLFRTLCPSWPGWPLLSLSRYSSCVYEPFYLLKSELDSSLKKSNLHFVFLYFHQMRMLDGWQLNTFLSCILSYILLDSNLVANECISTIFF